MIYQPVGIAVGRFVLGFLLLAPLACGGSDLVLPGPGSTGETAADIEAIEGNGQSGVAGTMLPDSIVVQVTDGTGAPVAGQQVEFAPSAPGAEVTPATATTDAGGIAWARWMLGVTSGTQTVIARVAGDTGLQIAFEASVRSASPQSIQAVNGDNQTGAAGTGLRDPLVVLVSDAFGNPVEDLAVTWVVGVGGGSVSSTTSLTDQDGQAQTRWTLGPNPGANTLNAVVSGVGVVAFSATAEGGGGGPTPRPDALRGATNRRVPETRDHLAPGGGRGAR